MNIYCFLFKYCVYEECAYVCTDSENEYLLPTEYHSFSTTFSSSFLPGSVPDPDLLGLAQNPDSRIWILSALSMLTNTYFIKDNLGHFLNVAFLKGHF